MIRSKRLPLPRLNTWLVDQNLAHAWPPYRLRLWREDRTQLAALLVELREYIDEALDDARRRMRRGFADNLSPFSGPAVDPAANYPALLHRSTLLGYLGETLAVLAVEHWGAHNHTDWVIPAFLFRLHDQEFQHLESINTRDLAGGVYDPDEDRELRPGRTGDDALAFRLTGSSITDVLTLEAKCLAHHNNGKINDAHEKLSVGGARPSGIRELINLLDEYDTPSAQLWQQALLELWLKGYLTAARYDGVAYACGNAPLKPPTRMSWMQAAAPNSKYAVHRKLEAMEFHFDDLPSLVAALYR